MARTFGSISELVSFIENNCHPDVISEISKTGTEIMKQVTEDQVEGNTGDIINCIGETERSNDSLTLAWQDNGSWFSLANETYGNHMYAPWALENGKTFEPGRPMFSGFYKEQTTLQETSTKLINDESKDIYRKILSSKGFRVI